MVELPTLRTVTVPPSSGSSNDFVFTSRYGAISYKTSTCNTDVITLCTFWCLYSSREIVFFQEFHYTKYKTHILVPLTIGEACMVTRLHRNKVKEFMWYMGGTCEQPWPYRRLENACVIEIINKNTFKNTDENMQLRHSTYVSITISRKPACR